MEMHDVVDVTVHAIDDVQEAISEYYRNVAEEKRGIAVRTLTLQHSLDCHGLESERLTVDRATFGNITLAVPRSEEIIRRAVPELRHWFNIAHNADTVTMFYHTGQKGVSIVMRVPLSQQAECKIVESSFKTHTLVCPTQS